MPQYMKIRGEQYKHYDTLSKKKADEVVKSLRAKGKIVAMRSIGYNTYAIWIKA